MTDPLILTGRCLCGAVSFRIRGPLRPAHACHCGMCRRQSGHFVVATDAAYDDVELIDDRGLRWYASSAIARRGFCAMCGSALFWDDGEVLSVAVGSLDDQTAVTLDKHIYVDEKPAFYEIGDRLPQFAQSETPMRKRATKPKAKR